MAHKYKTLINAKKICFTQIKYIFKKINQAQPMKCFIEYTVMHKLSPPPPLYSYLKHAAHRLTYKSVTVNVNGFMKRDIT